MTIMDYSSSAMEDTIDTLYAMRKQEGAYTIHDYLHQEVTTDSELLPSGPLDRVDVECRSKMVSWCFQVVDFCKFDRETVSIAVSYLDRFLASETGRPALADRKYFQLAAMTCLYTAVKIHEPEAMAPELVSNLSRGAYSPKQIEEMEASILGAIQWRLNPPTSLAFARMFMNLIPEIDASIRDTLYDVVKFQTELAVGDYGFINARASTVGFVSLMNALESLGMDSKALGNISYSLSTAAGIDLNDYDVVSVKESLYNIIGGSENPPLLGSAQRPVASRKISRRMSVEVSPQSVSALR